VLAELGLSHNKLTSLPTSLGTLTSLSYFEAKNNRLRSIPTEVGSLIYLVTLDVVCYYYYYFVIVIVVDDLRFIFVSYSFVFFQNEISDVCGDLIKI
jgi:hypothetical protein